MWTWFIAEFTRLGIAELTGLVAMCTWFIAEWTWLSVAGTAFELGGLGIALWGVDQLGRELSLGHVVPHRRASRWLKRTLGFKSKPTNAEVGTAASGFGGAFSARVLKAKARPSDDDAPPSEWHAYWDSRLENLSVQLAWLMEDTKEADRDLGQRLSDEAAERQTADAELSERLRVVLAGEGGSGLVKTWSGLALTLFGVLLSGVAQVIG